ncbi:MAG TPA: formate dehydrogenase accessory protein FdhE [Terriglobia bacterium]|nr:formate dehydrogenase accessory protein FdhE [Terriglobia bacterium]
MSRSPGAPGAAQPDPSAIGGVQQPPFAQLPDPLSLFDTRARRFKALAEASALQPYLRFVAGLAQIQHGVQADLLEPSLPAAADIERARGFEMPPLARGGFAPDAAFAMTLERLLAAAREVDMPAPAAAALEKVRQADSAGRHEMTRLVLANTIPAETLSEHVFVALALQVHFARLAARLDAKRLVPVGDGACPCCGGPPVASVIVGWPSAHGARYCACALCGTLWNYVRIRCTQCGSTKGIGYQEVEGGAGTVKAETCDSCHAYVKVLYQDKDPSLEPVADDVASLGLDLLMREGPYRRGAFNIFLLGY